MPPLKNHIPLISGLFLALGAVVLVLATPVPGFSKPPISWEPENVTETIAQGEEKTKVISFTSKKDLTNVSVWIVPELQPYVSVTPSSFSSIGKGDLVTLTLTFSAPADAPLETFEGTIHLRNNSGKSKKTYSKSLPITLTVTVVPLPPDPGEAGKATLEGIDSDGDGVRDDIQRYIALTYPESERTRAALTQSAKALQDALLDAEDRDASILNAEARSNATTCLSYILGGAREARVVFNDLLSVVVNTEERLATFSQADNQLGGQVTRLPSIDERKFSCAFDPETMEN